MTRDDDFAGWDVEDSDPWDDPPWIYRPADGVIAPTGEQYPVKNICSPLGSRIAVFITDTAVGISFVGFLICAGVWLFARPSWLTPTIVWGAAFLVILVVDYSVKAGVKSRRAKSGYPLPSGLQNPVWALHQCYQEIQDLCDELPWLPPSRARFIIWRRFEHPSSKMHAMFLALLDDVQKCRDKGDKEQFYFALAAVLAGAEAMVCLRKRLAALAR